MPCFFFGVLFGEVGEYTGRHFSLWEFGRWGSRYKFVGGVSFSSRRWFWMEVGGGSRWFDELMVPQWP